LQKDMSGVGTAVAPRMVAESSLGERGGMELPPVAPMLMQSLRSVGYSTSAALADLVDNSIAASAKTVRISVAMAPRASVAVSDDGTGMDEETLLAAMRFGSRDPRSSREGADLGRFGLGLKTASLSQCRRLTVVTLKDGQLSIARWDLDECDRRGTWWLERPLLSELPHEPIAILEEKGYGTSVVWEELDRLETAGGDRAVLNAADHLALAFHRFLAGEVAGPFTILLNERPLAVIDPFLEGHTRGQALHTERVPLDGHVVTVTPFVLPYPSRLKPADLELVGGRESLKTAHGFYIYRGGRLVVPGGWFRIVPADDLIRLARIRVDIPVELDHLWKIDIRKAIAEPPQALRPHLKRIVGAVATRSRRVYTHKGTPSDDRERVLLWRRHDMRDAGAAWRINRNHPAVTLLLSGPAAEEAEAALKLFEENLPIHDIHIYTVNDLPVAEPDVPDEPELESIARRIVSAFSDQPEIASRILERLPVTEPFNRNPDAAVRIAERLRNEL
jgi:Histidine kinase-, DNA gyrase B-, and HSP90-like ATPase